MSKDCFPKLKGSICNIPIHANEINDIQPHGTDSNGLGTAKLKNELLWVVYLKLFVQNPLIKPCYTSKNTILCVRTLPSI